MARGARRCWTLMIQLSPLLGPRHLGDQSQKQRGCLRVFPEAGFISGHILMRSVGKKLLGGPSEAESWLRPRGGAREVSSRDSAAGLQGHAEGGAPVHGRVSERGAQADGSTWASGRGAGSRSHSGSLFAGLSTRAGNCRWSDWGCGSLALGCLSKPPGVAFQVPWYLVCVRVSPDLVSPSTLTEH